MRRVDVEALLRDFRTADDPARGPAAARLLDCAADALDQGSGEERRQILAALEEIGGKRAATLLCEALFEVSDAERAAVEESLTRMGRSAVAALCRLLSENGSDEDGDAVRVLGRIGSPAAAPALARAACDWRPAVRRAGCEALIGLLERGHYREVAAELPMMQGRAGFMAGLESEREPMRRLLERIDAARKLHGALPLPAERPRPEPEALPRPAEAPEGRGAV